MRSNRRNWLIAIEILAPLLFVSTASAQAPPSTRPAYSPYLNLTRPGNVANNYYGLVRPQMEFRNSIDNLQQRNLAVPSAGSANPNDAELPATGRGATFMNYSHYYSGFRSAGSNNSAPGAAAPGRRR